MYKVTGYRLQRCNIGYDNEDIDIVITTDPPKIMSISHNFEKREGIYRAEAGDLVKFYSYTGPSTGFGGMICSIHMADGSHETLEGPWSSRTGVVNMLYPDREPIVECITEDRFVVAVKAMSLMKLGMLFQVETKWDGEVYFRPFGYCEADFLTDKQLIDRMSGENRHYGL